jgi:hypothetical protein
MATRSTISMKTDEGKFRTIYCHWDGYPSYNGAMLNENYTDPAKIKSLIDLGSISSLREEIGEKHPFDRNYEAPELDLYGNWTSAYHRDRGEEWSRTAPMTFNDTEEMIELSGEEYAYVWNGDDWLVHEVGNNDSKGYPIFDYVETVLKKEAA